MSFRSHAGSWLAAGAALFAVVLWPGLPNRGEGSGPAPLAEVDLGDGTREPTTREVTGAIRPDGPAVEPDDGPALVAVLPEPVVPVPPEAAVPGAAVLARPAADLPRFSDAELSQVKDAVAAYRRGEVALGDAIRNRTTNGTVRTFLEWVAVRTGGPGVDFDRLAAFMAAHPRWPGQANLRRRAEDQLVAERRPATALITFFAGEKPQSPAGKFALAGALRADGKGEAAAALVRDTWRNDVFGRELESRILDGFKDTLTVADHRFRMERFLHRENWESATRAAGYAGPGYDALVKARMAVESRSKLAGKLLDGVPAALKQDTSYLFSRAQHLRRAEKASEAAKVIAAVSTDPAVLADGDEWWVERRLIARKLLDEGDPKAAYAVAAGHGAVSGERRIEAEFHAGWIALRFLKKPDVARAHFDKAAAISGTPISLARSAYWRGRAADDLGLQAEARDLFGQAARYGTTYYGQLATARLGDERMSARLLPPSLIPERRAAAATPGVQAVALALAAGLRELALPLVVDLARTGQDTAELELLAEVLLEVRDARALLSLGKLATQRGLPLDEAAFPVGGVPSFEPVGNRVERALVHAIARQESAFDPAALSSAGARGLMQMMPATAQATAKKAGVEYEPARMNDATYNARLGAAHLGDLMQDWKGSFVLTFAAYNAGPGNVKKWIQAYGDPRDPDVDTIDWVERIPFSETRNYVQRVMENLQVYRARLGEQSTLLIASDLKAGGSAGR